MSEERLGSAVATLETADGFVPQSDPTAFVADVTPFEASVELGAGSDAIRFAVTVRVPTLDAVTADRVDPVVHEGWLDTFELRLEDLDGATRSDVDPPTVALDADREEVSVETQFETTAPDRGVADTRAVIQYVEGTYMEGVIPGYDYREPVAGMLQRAAEKSGVDSDLDPGPGGTPL